MSVYEFNQAGVLLSPAIGDLDSKLIEGTLNLRRASLTDAALFGGPLIRTCLEQAPLKGDREYVFVDTKVSLLMPGWMPAIPGWHTDGVPRGVAYGQGFDSASTGAPSMKDQQRQSDTGYFPRYHTIIVGNDCPTKFLVSPLKLDLENSESEDLYAEMTRLVDERIDSLLQVCPSRNQWASWDWWNIHAATEAIERGWRLLIRITESDTVTPVSAGFIRAQNQVYVPREFGW